MICHFYALLFRQKHIRRWSLMRNTSPENVAEHTLQTAYLAHALALISRDVFRFDVRPEVCALHAMYHDCAEIFTGDLPTPVKYWSPAIRDAYREVEEDSAARLLRDLPEAIRPALEETLREPAGREARIVGAADKLAAHIKCLEELQQGNGEFKLAARQTRARLLEMELPETEYFMAHFLPSFSLTLDELQ